MAIILPTLWLVVRLLVKYCQQPNRLSPMDKKYNNNNNNNSLENNESQDDKNSNILGGEEEDEEEETNSTLYNTSYLKVQNAPQNPKIQSKEDRILQRRLKDESRKAMASISTYWAFGIDPMRLSLGRILSRMRSEEEHNPNFKEIEINTLMTHLHR